ncbi:MAG: hypothetical protein V3V46_01440 [Anaerolineales bacterium]
MRAKVFWIGGVVVLLLLASLGACVSSDSTKTSETAGSVEIDQLFDDYIAAFNDYDVDAFQALITDGYMSYATAWDPQSAVSTPLDRLRNLNGVLEMVELYYPSNEVQWERLGDPIMTGDGPWLVSQVIRRMSNEPQYPNGIEGISILTIVDEAGTLKVARYVFVAFEVK